ncbi:bacterial peptide chain release factor 1 (bRF-1) [Geoalkalibacter ferrihydriticus]|uniref:Peptide chain release factor 1 n=2 Tax=Geoalkalibacter ferrihydriticus TaxID=392333 RepID=A0A0C2HT25_9BACT|nr:peptide chain release factor 1 [Geoalkalibacter ferrihydriticus]KIH75942.1 peptide chain release factor 1 [Geoalkalibacter ferrihydriticus DSM 17813]SDM56350.1 bacterial peptide chain release factor 1 (bRF-1) [Geoalkalibacter ferrihydriticus]
MFNKLEEVVDRFREVEGLLSDPTVVSNQEKYRALTKEHSSLSEVVEVFQRYKKVCEAIAGNRELLRDPDPEVKEMARAELPELEGAKEQLEKDLHFLLLPRDPNDDKNILLEVRAGTGGEEAALFAADLFRMYSRYADAKGWKVEIMSLSEADAGGIKEVIALIRGNRVYSRLKFESGTHRVQRVPATEAQGRIHTSACTVAVLPEADEVDLDIDPGDLRIDVYRSSGAGGQHVNKTDSAVRITHIPTGVAVACQDEKSQHKNKAKAMKILSSRILESLRAEQDAKMAADRKSQVGSGDRSERIRTYNFPQGRCTDHRIGLTLYRLEAIMQGDLDEIVDALTTHSQSDALSGQEA